MNLSIKKRLTGNFMLIILITVIILEVILLNGIKQYYYNSIEELLSNQISFSSEEYMKSLTSSDLTESMTDDTEIFWKQFKAQVQIIDNENKVLMDSIGVTYEDNIIISPDVTKALSGDKGTWTGEVNYSNYPVMSVSYPLKYDGEIIGVMRFITTLEYTNSIISNISKTLVLIGIGAVIVSGLLSLFLANSIIRPLSEVTEVAEKMADGQLKVRSKKVADDEIGKLSDTLNYMAEELLKREQLKNDFVSSISHELRTPLTSIKGWAITLKGEDLGDNALMKDGLDIIEKESDRLSGMVEDLLDFSKFVSGRITLNKEEIDLSKVMRQVHKQLTPKADELGIDLTLKLEKESMPMIGDKNRIKQVLINLLDNGIKFTPTGGRVHLSGYSYDDFVLIQVEDTGQGIPEEDLPYITERFYKGKDSKSHSGLGLSIVDEIVILHGGDMDIKSILGTGTKILISLPIRGGEKK